MLDVMVICLSVFVVLYIANETWSKWTGKAEFIISELILLIFGWLYLGFRKFPQIRMFRWYPIPREVILPCLLMAISGVVLLDELDRLVGLVMPLPEVQLEALEEAFVPATLLDLFLIIIGVTIIAPITEESLFRGFIQQTLEKKWDITKAVLISAAIFALIHIQPWWVLQQAILAVFIGYLAWRWNSIIPPILIHGANNLWALRSIIGLTDDVIGYYNWKDHVHPILLIIALIIFYLGFRTSERIYYKLERGEIE